MNEYSKHFKIGLPKNTTENGTTNDKSKQYKSRVSTCKLDRKVIRKFAEEMLQMEISQESITNSTVEHKFKLSEDVMQLLNAGRNQKWLMVGCIHLHFKF
jgi:peptide methionine sulfoxide reductase MsrA